MIRRIFAASAIAGLAFFGTASIASAETAPAAGDPVSDLLGGLLGGGGGDPISGLLGGLLGGGGSPLDSLSGLTGGLGGVTGAVPGLGGVTAPVTDAVSAVAP